MSRILNYSFMELESTEVQMFNAAALSKKLPPIDGLESCFQAEHDVHLFFYIKAVFIFQTEN